MASRFKRVALVAGMAVAAVSLWTLAPLLGLWVGAQIAGQKGLTMGALAMVVITMLVVCLALVRALGWLGFAYDEAVGRPQSRRRAPWLKAISGERAGRDGIGAGLRALDYTLVGAVLLCYLAFQAWFFFLSGSSI